MKLIDLLVQELPKRGGWPLNVKSLEQCHDGCIQSFEGPAEYHVRLPLAEDWESVVQYVDYKNVLDKLVWSGDGLPTVGTEIEVDSPRLGWAKAKVVAVTDTWLISKYDNGVESAVCHRSKSSSGVWVDHYGSFRPIKNEAEIKREKVIASMRKSVTNYNKTDVIQALEQVYDAIVAGKIIGVKIEV